MIGARNPGRARVPGTFSADEANKFRGFAEKAIVLGKWGGAGFTVVGGTFDVYEDANNPKSTTEDKEKALTVDVASTAATVGADLLIAATLPASVPIIAGIAIGVVVGAGISYGAKWAKKEWIDR